MYMNINMGVEIENQIWARLYILIEGLTALSEFCKCKYYMVFDDRY